MKIPNKNFTIKVGPFVYEVIFSQDIASEGACFGSTHHGSQRIFLDPDLKRQKLEQTFLHEVLHACSFVSGLVYRFDKEQHPGEEDVVRELSMILFQVIKDNPTIFERR